MSSMIYKGLLGAVVAVASLAASAGTIVGSAHDFTLQAGQVCAGCHAPHVTASAANPAGSGAPLWNHAWSATQAYTLYSTSTMNATTAFNAANVGPGTTSRLCLSCHDGTIATNSFGAPSLGTDLSNDHPIGIVYDAALVTADPSLRAITSAANIGSGTTVKTGTIAQNMLFAGKVECASCHDVHNTYTASTKLVKTAAATICTTCHAK